MKRSLKIYFLPAILLLVVGTVLGMRLESASSSDNTLEQLKKLEHAFVTINRQYVEDVEAEVIAEKGIEAMLKQLDPHSTYISAKEIKEIQEGYQGSFGGIGIWFEIPRNDDNLADDTARVVAEIADPRVIYHGSQFVHRTTDEGSSAWAPRHRSPCRDHQNRTSTPTVGTRGNMLIPDRTGGSRSYS